MTQGLFSNKEPDEDWRLSALYNSHNFFAC